MKSKSLFKWFFVSALVGYSIIHPILIATGYLIHIENINMGHSLHDDILNSFSFQRLPWGIAIAFVCGIIGYLYRGLRLNEGLLRNAKKDLERKVEVRTEKLFKANKMLTREIVQRKRAEQRLMEQVRLATLGAEIGEALVQSKDLESLLQVCAESIVAQLDAAFARIWTLNEKKNSLELMASAGMYTHKNGHHGSIPVGKFKIGIIAQNKQPHFTNSVIGDSQVSDQEWAKKEGMIAFAGHPLIVADKLVGVMGVFAKKRLHENDLNALASIADEIALGIERKKAEDQIHFLAYYDKLTALPNRFFFKELLEKSIEYVSRYNQTCVIAIIDLDDFKRINDTFGHNIGDEFIKIVCSRLLKILRSSDNVARMFEDRIARMGGDEFVVLLQNLNNVLDASHIAKRILDGLSHVYEIGGHEIFITASIGIAAFPGDGKDSDDLIKNADTALNHAKKTGKNKFQFYSKSMNEAALEFLTMETNLRRAIERQELLLYYQPKVDIATRKIIGMEALVRWKTDKEGLISPAKFIPLAEENGLILPIGNFVLQAGCLQNKVWQKAGIKKVGVAINVSGLQFGQKDFVQEVLTILKNTGLDPQYLELEITETTIMKNIEMAVQNLNELKKAGIKVSLDDFGTGYSSLSYLQRMPLDSIKIDISFIRNVAVNPDDAAIVKTIITMAHNLNLKVIAEGVEDEHQLEFLEAHGCDMIQGYFFSPPVPAEKFFDLLIQENIFMNF